MRVVNGGSVAFGPRRVVDPSMTRWTSRWWKALSFSRWGAQSTIVAVAGSRAVSAASPTMARGAGATKVAPAVSTAVRFQ